MKALDNKDESIQRVTKSIRERFKQVEITDFWDSDNSAIGLKEGKRLIYVSTWDFRFLPADEMKYYAVFEYFEDEALDNKILEKEYRELSEEQLLLEISLLLEKG